MTTSIGDRVRIQRRRRGLTQARLAHLVGRSDRWLHDVEHGDVDPRLSDAIALARVLGIAVDDLAGGTHGSSGVPVSGATHARGGARNR
jgi:transcriptional regulator with XRE-family HTH domain